MMTPLGDPIYGQCAFCGQSLTAGHQCPPLFPRIHQEQQMGQLTFRQLTEEDVRRIVREELKLMEGRPDRAKRV
jgi:hypothetical protein